MRGNWLRNVNIDALVGQITDKPILPDDLDIRDCALEAPINRIGSWDDSRVLEGTRAKRKMSPYKSNIFLYLKACLDHVRANPSNKGNIEALQAIYAFPTSTVGEIWSGQVLATNSGEFLNTSDSKVDQVAQDLSDIAQDARALFELKLAPEASKKIDLATPTAILGADEKIVLVGKRGSGKTTFLNYLLSTKNHIFERNAVIWFRLDLTKGDFDIQDWFRWQFCRVVLKYYAKKEIGTESAPVALDISENRVFA